VKSPIKWAGGKGKLIEVIKSVLPPPSECDRLIEPFVGGANVFLNTEYKEYVLGDVNKDLICLYQCIKEDPDQLINDLNDIWEICKTETDYYGARNVFNMIRDCSIRRSAMFVYLNRHGYNGLCRYNKNGDFNVPYGYYKKPYLPIADVTLMSLKLNSCHVDLWHDDFENVMRKAKYGEVIYCDPPYVPISATSSFTSYAKGGFDMPDQIRLAKTAEELSAKGVHIIIHNHDLPITRELYRNADQIVEVNVQRNISCKGDSREKVKELIAVYLPK